MDDNQDAAESLGDAAVLRWTRRSHRSHRARPPSTRCSESPADIVLLDIGLPDIDGYEVARRIRAIPELARARVIALTGYGQIEDRRRTEAAGFDDHLGEAVD